tara:strand:- start:87 stop:1904 length:1818 start_codon:yes stop_codon:yes gene_type:complete
MGPMLSFKDYKEISDIIIEATVSAGKYGPGSLFTLKTDKISAFENKVGDKLKLPSSPVFSKLDPAKIPSDALIFGDNTQQLRAAFEILDAPDGKSVGSFAWHEKAVDNYFNGLKLGSDINWGKDTPTLETVQALGVYYKNIEADAGDRQKVIDNIKSILGNGQDWDSKGKANLISKFDTMTSKNFAEMIGLIAGMVDFMPIVKFKANIIHGRINDYYAAEEQNDNVEITGVKANTADMIISSADASKTIEAMKTDTFTFDKKGVITGKNSKINLIQVSLKKSADKAQLGKVTAYIIQKYGLPSYDDYFTDIVSESFQMNEGVFDIFKTAAEKIKGLYLKVAKSIQNFALKITSRFKKAAKSEKKTVFAKYQKLFGLDKADMLMMEQYIEGDKFLIEKKAVGNLNSKLEKISISNANKLVTEVQKKRNGIVKLYDTKDYLIHKTGTEITNFRTSKEINIDIVAKLLSNSYSLSSVESIIGTTNSDEILSSVIDMHKEVYFGKTSLPMYKVYGKSKGKSYEYLGSASDYVEKKKAKLKEVQFPISGIRLNTQDKKYLNIDLYVVSDIEDNQIYYTAFRTGTNASGRFSFNFEGTKKIPYEKFIKFLK